MPDLAQNKKYTYKDYLTWPDGERWEIINGVPYMMSPAPRITHQAIVTKITRWLDVFLDGKPCDVFVSPIDVRFENEENEDTVVQPDVVVVCDPKTITLPGIIGAPSVIFEVLSPSTAAYDMRIKYSLYEAKGVMEYWIVSPDERLVLRHCLENGKYAHTPFYYGAAESKALEGFCLDVDALFAALDQYKEI